MASIAEHSDVYVLQSHTTDSWFVPDRLDTSPRWADVEFHFGIETARAELKRRRGHFWWSSLYWRIVHRITDEQSEILTD